MRANGGAEMSMATTRASGVSVSSAWEKADEGGPLAPVGSQFPLGPPFGVDSDPDEKPSERSRPFGLRLLVEPHPEEAVDMTEVNYCEDRQMSMIGDESIVFLATRFTTSSQTRADSQVWTDYDQDTDP